MKLNFTFVLLGGIALLVGYALFRKVSSTGPTTGTPNGGTTSGVQLADDLAKSIGSIFSGITAIAKTTPSTNGGNPSPNSSTGGSSNSGGGDITPSTSMIPT